MRCWTLRDLGLAAWTDTRTRKKLRHPEHYIHFKLVFINVWANQLLLTWNLTTFFFYPLSLPLLLPVERHPVRWAMRTGTLLKFLKASWNSLAPETGPWTIPLQPACAAAMARRRCCQTARLEPEVCPYLRSEHGEWWADTKGGHTHSTSMGCSFYTQSTC